MIASTFGRVAVVPSKLRSAPKVSLACASVVGTFGSHEVGSRTGVTSSISAAHVPGMTSGFSKAGGWTTPRQGFRTNVLP